MSTCPVCGKKAYQMEAIVIEGVTMHKNCFKCSVCKKTLNGANFAKNHGIYYCKVHFQQMFKEKGNYDEGFGHSKHSAEWEKKDESQEQPKDVEQKEPAKEEEPIQKKEEEPIHTKEEKKEEKPVEVKKEEPIHKKEEKKEEFVVSADVMNQVESILKQLDKIDGACSKLEGSGIVATGSINSQQIDNVFGRLNQALDKLEHN